MAKRIGKQIAATDFDKEATANRLHARQLDELADKTTNQETKKMYRQLAKIYRDIAISCTKLAMNADR